MAWKYGETEARTSRWAGTTVMPERSLEWSELVGFKVFSFSSYHCYAFAFVKFGPTWYHRVGCSASSYSWRQRPRQNGPESWNWVKLWIREIYIFLEWLWRYFFKRKTFCWWWSRCKGSPGVQGRDEVGTFCTFYQNLFFFLYVSVHPYNFKRSAGNPFHPAQHNTRVTQIFFNYLILHGTACDTNSYNTLQFTVKGLGDHKHPKW